MIPNSPFRAALFLVTALVISAQNASSAAEPDPSLQVERDWVDNRWSRTDVGSFLASNLDLPGLRVAKALSIKIGDNAEGAVCFDTAECVMRAGWLGGFLRFSPARFGLINSPRVDGELAFTSAAKDTSSSSNHYAGLHLHGKRVVLDYTINGTRVLESPWLERQRELKIFTRSFEVAASDREITLPLADGLKNVVVSPSPAGTRAVGESGSKQVALILQSSAAKLEHKSGGVSLVIPERKSSVRLKLLLWSGDKSSIQILDSLTNSTNPPEDFTTLLQPGVAQWQPELKTVGERGLDTDILAVDTLTVPYDNPWKALMFLAGVDFTADGAAYVCSIHGDVWRVTGIDDRLRELRWKRFATGLFQPLGLKVRDNKVFVLGRDQITCLHDLNGDGETDFYENFSNLIETSPGHNYVTCLEKDDAGRFYFVDPRGVHRVSRDGQRLETLATGFRNPNGMGVSPDGKVITVAPQQGEWTPSSEICEIRLGQYFGYGGPKINSQRPLGYDMPLCWIPHSVDNSSGSQVWVPPGQWDALGGQMLHLLWGRCGLMLALRDVSSGTAQGAVVRLPERFLSGPQRGSFNSADGHLYVACSTGWQTSAVKEGALHRVRRTARPIYLPTAWHARANEISLTFAQPLERAAAEDIGSYSVQQWNYRYAREYGSKDWSAADPRKEGRDEVVVRSARLSADGKTIVLEIPRLQPVMQMEVKYDLNAADGKNLKNQMWLTVNGTDPTPH